MAAWARMAQRRADNGSGALIQRRSDTRGRRRRSDSSTVGRRIYGVGARGHAAQAWHVADTRREHVDRQARRGKRRLAGGSLMSAISELKCTPG
jgi:hypothetical protein